MSNISLTKPEAYAILELPVGADTDAIRTSYKRLAQKWYPDKHAKQAEALTNFQKISRAYKRLDSSSDKVLMTTDDMLSIYQKTVLSKSKRQIYLDDDFNSSDSNELNSSDEEEANDFFYLLRPGAAKISKNNRHEYTDSEEEELNDDTDLAAAAQREQLANELISGEEQKKIKLDKRRAKKKLRREKKRIEKEKTVAAAEAQKKVTVDPKKKGKVKEEKVVVVKESEDKKSRSVSSSDNSDEEEEEEEEESNHKDVVIDTKAAVYHTSKSKVVPKEMTTTTTTSHRSSDHPESPPPPAPVNNNPVIKKDPVPSVKTSDPTYIQSRQLAIEGNARANKGQYREAIQYFTKAIQLDPIDFRFYGNRSYCHERLGEFDEALADGNKAISLSADWPKGYYRQGIALAGLKLYSRAEESFTRVLKLDSRCEDAKHELYRVRAYQLMEMGFSLTQAELAILKYVNVQPALDCLLSNLVLEDNHSPWSSEGEQRQTNGSKRIPFEKWPVNDETRPVNGVASSGVVGSNGSDSKPSEKVATNALKKKNKVLLQPIPASHYEESQRQILINKQFFETDGKMNPHNPDGLTSLWVGNVLPEVTPELVTQLFSAFGKLQNVRCLPEKYCAFVNFYSKECAGRAMQALQGKDCHGQNLLIKFPDNPLTSASAISSSTTEPPTASKIPPIPAKAYSTATKVVSNPVKFEHSESSVKHHPQLVHRQNQQQQQQVHETNRVTGPVNGNECYFWRTTGCQFATGCRFRHVPEHKGIDRKPWQKMSK